MTVLLDVESRGWHHCETTALGVLLRHQGLDLSEPMLFGLGGGLSFVYWDAKGMDVPFLGGRVKPFDLTRNLAARLGATLTVSETASPGKAWRDVVEHLDAERRQAALPPLPHRVEETAVRDVVSAAPDKPDAPDSQFVKNPQEREIVAYRVQPLERKQERDLSPGVRRRDLRGVPAQREETGALRHLFVERGDHIERAPQRHLRNEPVRDEERRDYDVHIRRP